MAINPMTLLHMKERLRQFRSDHPKVSPFLHAVKRDSLAAGTVCELKITSPEGKSRVMNIKLTEEDIKTIQMLTNAKKD